MPYAHRFSQFAYLIFWLCLTAVSPPLHGADPEQAVDAFQAATAQLLAEGRSNGEKYSELVQEMADIMAANESAAAALRSGQSGRLESLARKNVTLGKRYVNEYREFLRQLDADSNCVKTPQTRRMLEQIQALEQAANKLPSLAATRDEMEAYAALMEINRYQVLVATVPNLFEAAQLCIVQDNLPALMENMQQLEALMGVAIDELDANATPPQPTADPLPNMEDWEIPIEHINVKVSFYPDQIPSFNDLSMVYVDSRSQLGQLRLSNGLTIDDNLMLVLPPSAGSNGHYTASISGTVETQDYIATLDIKIERLASKAIAGLSGMTGSLKSCIDTAAKQQMADYAHQLEVLSCEFTGDEFVSLDALSELPNLSMLVLNGGTLGPLTPLGHLPHLSHLTFADTQIPQFGDLSAIRAAMQFANVSSDDWIALATSATDSIMLEQIPDCSALSKLANAPEVAWLLNESSGEELSEYLRQLDSGEKHIGIIASCGDQ